MKTYIYEVENCEHKNFDDGQCKECDAYCDHPDSEDGYCLMCGELMMFFERPESMDFPDKDGDR